MVYVKYYTQHRFKGKEPFKNKQPRKVARPGMNKALDSERMWDVKI